MKPTTKEEREEWFVAAQLLRESMRLPCDDSALLRLIADVDRLEARLAEIDKWVKADADDLAKMRDGTKLTRAGLVATIVESQLLLDEMTAERDAARLDERRRCVAVLRELGERRIGGPYRLAADAIEREAGPT